MVAAIPVLLGLALVAAGEEPAASPAPPPAVAQPADDAHASPADAPPADAAPADAPPADAPPAEGAPPHEVIAPAVPPRAAKPPKTSKAPAAPAAADPRGKMVKRSLATTTWPVEPAFNAGFVVSRDSFAPFAGATVYVPVWPGIGPTAVVRASGAQLGELSFGEAIIGVGPSLESNLGGLRARATIAASALVAGYSHLDDGGVTVGPAVLVPLEVGLPLGGGVSFTLTIEPGVSRSITHVVDGAIAYSRDRAFVYVGAGVNFGGPPD